MLRVVVQLKMKRKRPREEDAQGCGAVKDEEKETQRRPRLGWLDNVDRHQKGKNTSLKEVLRTNCFGNRHDWRTLMSRTTDGNSGI